MTKSYVYDAFISYRHAELDKYAAELLHRQLESFRLPGNLARQRKDGRTRINRVFRDKDELPLTNNLEDPILQALQSSEFLIVICSPRLRESLWCRKEIETFISMHGREKILAVLIEGEPEDSFPEELLYREEVITDADGNSHTERIPMEPLAADIRGKDRQAMKKALKTELLRLLAPIFSLNYDDLRQRHRERRMKRILAASLSVGAVCLAFGTVSTVMALRIQNQKTQIEAQAEEIREQNQEIQKQNQEIQKQNQEITEQNLALLTNQAVTLSQESLRMLDEGDRIGAIQTAVSALTSYRGNDLPYTPEAQFALTKSLYAYDYGIAMKPQLQTRTAGIIRYIKVSGDGNVYATYDNSQCLTLWETHTGSKIEEFRDIETMTESSFILQGSKNLIYINNERQAVVYDIAACEVDQVLDFSRLYNVYGDPNGKRLILTDFYGIRVLDGATFTEVEYYELVSPYNITISDDGTYMAFQEKDKEGNRLLHVWNLETGEKYPDRSVGARSLKDIRYRDGIAYLLLNDSGDDWSYMEVTAQAYRLETGELLWEYQSPNCFGSQVVLPAAEGATRLALILYDEVRLLELSDGTEAGHVSYGTGISGWAVYTDNDYFVMFTRNGEYHMLDGASTEDYVMSDAFLSHSQNVMEFLTVSGGGFLLLPYQDNRVTYYNFSHGDLVPYEGSIQVPETESYSILDSNTKAQELGLENAALVYTLFYDEEKTRLFVVYRDDSMDIYDTSDMSLLGTIVRLESTLNSYVGTDAQGNLFLKGYSQGYMLNPEYQPLAVIEGLVCVDSENNRVILENRRSKQLYQLPIYKVEELLAKARDDVL